MECLYIAVCEDSITEQEQLLAILKRSEIPTEITFFTNGEDFLTVYQQGNYDLLLMDIYMNGINGVEAVTEIRKTDQTLPIAFVTTSTDHALESYRLDAIKYIEKPVNEKAILELLKFTLFKKEREPRLMLKVGGENRTLPFGRILYVEQKDHALFFYLLGGEVLRITGKLNKIEPQFEGQPFFRCHKSYLVNLSHVMELDKGFLMFVMNEGSKVYIRRESLSKAKKAYEAHLFATVRGDGDE